VVRSVTLDQYAAMIGSFCHQSTYYRSNGPPRLTDVGRAPIYCAVKWLAASAESERQPE